MPRVILSRAGPGRFLHIRKIKYDVPTVDRSSMSSGDPAPPSDRIYKWMPEPAAAQAMGVSVQAIRQSVIRGSLKARVTSAGIAQVLVRLSPWSAVEQNGLNITFESAAAGIESQTPRSAARPFAHLLAGMNEREKVTWLVVVIAYLSLVSLGIHASRSVAGTGKHIGQLHSNSMSTGSRRTEPPPRVLVGSQPTRQSHLKMSSVLGFGSKLKALITIAANRVTTHESFEMDDSLPPDIQPGAAPPPFDPQNRTELSFEHQSDNSFNADPATPSDGVLKRSEFAMDSSAPASDASPWTQLQTSQLSAGSEINWVSETVPQAGINSSPLLLGFVDLSKSIGASSTASIASALRLGSTPGGSTSGGSGSVGADNSGSSPFGLGAEPDLGNVISVAPEPSSLVLLGLAAGPIVLRRRRGPSRP